MQVEVKRLGNVKVTGSQQIVFEQGLPGFEQQKEFTLLELEIDLPVKLLQSVEMPEITLLVGDPFRFYPDYDWELTEHAQLELCITDSSQVEVLSVIILPSNAAEATINLLAPIVINKEKQIAKQLILHNTPYSNRHPLIRAAGQGE
ncbi:flagellar assembly factor FliW [Paenibacillus phyllosphaerae]|uniref:Flagellar assembly factor FliW n=1 Tax=Paenibacillus phyllosphaerae TaxID=274593 RepID=A0A7W5AX85_9BACL|nr:flagellar assembly protein FliW [Paenibacillus phyllosphaerae]MBB3110493.1 flagellar assembly factor FliW [Paenibacillus phyllosphaerae]